MHHDILAVQSFFFDNVQEKIFRIGNIKGNWNAEMGTDAEGINKINKFDVVKYEINYTGQYFLAYADYIPIGTLPTETSYYLQITIQGEKGLDGADGKDGESGTGLTPRGNYLISTDYFKNDLVSYNGKLYYALQGNTSQLPDNENSEYWEEIHISIQTFVSNIQNDHLESFGLWVHIQDDGHVILKTPNGELYNALYPETKTDYVFDQSGKSLQETLYQMYFNRDDVITTITEADNIYTSIAKLKENEIIVAKNIITDSFDDSNTIIDELFIYDETGVNLLYHLKNTTIMDESGMGFTNTPEIIKE